MNNKKEPLNLEYFDDVLDLFYDNINENEKLYKELHTQYNNSQASGFSLGVSKNGVELSKTLSSIRATAISGVSALFNAKKSIADLEIKKKSLVLDTDKVENDKEFIRKALEEIQGNSNNKGSVTFNGKTVSLSKNYDKTALDRTIDQYTDNGAIAMSKNEKFMKLDFNGETEYVLDSKSGDIKAVFKGTENEIPEYPIERAQISKIIKVESGLAYSDNGKTVRVVEVK
jgi:hypothetical protein